MVKSHLLFVFSVLISSAALAGTPENDPAISYLRSEFQRAILPSDDALKAGKSWDCANYSAHDNDFTVNRGIKIVFSKYDGLTLASVPGTNESLTFAPITGALSSSDDTVDSNVMFFLRVTERGNLIIEQTIAKEKTAAYGITDAPPAVLKPERFAFYYTVCPADPAK